MDVQPLFTIKIAVHPMQDAGATPLGYRFVVPVSGGHFKGRRLRGKVLPQAGSDWLLRRADGVFHINVRLTLETDDGAVILMSYQGLRNASLEVSDRISRGEWVDRGEYYLRIAAFFETGDHRYDWLNRILAVGMGERLPDGPVYEIYEVL